MGLAVYLILHVGYLQYSVLRQRHLPIEPDDAYSYMLKASQLLECPHQDCPALTDLRAQLEAPSPDGRPGGASWIRGREYFRLAVQYHPLHSLLLLVVHAAGASWDSAYNGVWLAGSVFVGWVVGRWL